MKKIDWFQKEDEDIYRAETRQRERRRQRKMKSRGTRLEDIYLSEGMHPDSHLNRRKRSC